MSAILDGPYGVAPVREDVDNRTALFVMNADGTGQRQITPFGIPAAHEAAGATWSPDGALLISATRDGRLFTLRPDGSRFSPIRLQLGGGNYFAFAPVFAPDGARIVFSALVGGAADVYSANPDGSDVRQLSRAHSPSDFPTGVARHRPLDCSEADLTVVGIAMSRPQQAGRPCVTRFAHGDGAVRGDPPRLAAANLPKVSSRPAARKKTPGLAGWAHGQSSRRTRLQQADVRDRIIAAYETALLRRAVS